MQDHSQIKAVRRALCLTALALSSGCFLIGSQAGGGRSSGGAEQAPAVRPEDALEEEALALETQGRYLDALGKRDAAIAIRTQELGPADGRVTHALLRAGELAWQKLHDRERALAYLTRTVLPAQSKNVFARLAGGMTRGLDGLSYLERAKLYSQLGKITESDADILQGRKLVDDLPPTIDPYGSIALQARCSQGAIYFERGALNEALAVLNEGRINVFSLLISSRVKYRLGDLAGAIEDLELSAEGVKHDLQRALSGMHRTAELAQLIEVGAIHQGLALAIAAAHPDQPRARWLALLTSGEMQARTYDALSYDRPAWFGAEQEALADTLADYRAQLSAKYLSSLTSDRQGRLDPELSAKITKIEETLRRPGNAVAPEDMSAFDARTKFKMFLASAERAEFPRGSIEAIQAGLGASLHGETALVTFVQHAPVDLANPEGLLPATSGPSRYAALLLRSGQSAPSLLDLGEAAALDEAIDALRTQLQNPTAPLEALQASSNALRGSIWSALASKLADVEHVYVVPDGALQLLPFDALYDAASGQWLSEQLMLSYLDSPRWLWTDRAPETASNSSAVVVADPPPPAGSYTLDDLSARHYPRLPGIEREASVVKSLLNARALLGADAQEANLRQLKRPSILHVASHALFLTSAHEQEEVLRPARGLSLQSAAAAPTAQPTTVGIEDLLRVALVLGPASKDAGDCCDSFMTGYELAALDLHGTQLVTLSACQTGVGRVLKVHGVSSLRRALMMAGAQSVLASLWQVSDDSATELMSHFYTELKRGASRLEALRRASARVRAQWPHPYHWATFTLSGQSGPLTRASASNAR